MVENSRNEVIAVLCWHGLGRSRVPGFIYLTTPIYITKLICVSVLYIYNSMHSKHRLRHLQRTCKAL